MVLPETVTSRWYGALVSILLVLPACIGTNNTCANSALSFDLKALEGKSPVYAIVILGSGPAGLSAGVYAGRGSAKTLILMGGKPGGLLTETSYIENWPGYEKILGREVMDKMMHQAAHFNAELWQDEAEKVDLTSWPFKITTQEGKEVYAMTLILATGASPRLLEISGEKEYWGRGVSTCAVCDAPFYKGKEVVVVGGGDSAVEEAIQLAKVARKVTILVRKDTMRAAPTMQQLLKGYPNISLLFNVEPREIKGDGNKVTGLQVYNNKTKEEDDVTVDGVFLAVGHIPNSAIIKNQVIMDKEGYVTCQARTQLTSAKGVYAAGEITDHRYRQAGYAAGQGIAAALDALALLNEIGFNTEVATQMGITIPVHEPVDVRSLVELDAAVADAPVALVDFGSHEGQSLDLDLPLNDRSIKIIKVDIDQAKDIAKKYYVFEAPVVLVFKKGALVGRFSQVVKTQEVNALLASLENDVVHEQSLVRA